MRAQRINMNRMSVLAAAILAASATAFAQEQSQAPATEPNANGQGVVANVPVEAATIPDAPPVSAVAVQPAARLSAAQLDQLTGPIALYPDPLLAATLAAAAYPADVAAAAKWRTENMAANDADIEAQPWPAPVKTLVRYPATLNLLAQYLDWTTALGNAYATQQADVMASVQRRRTQAVAQKNLFNTPQQQVVTTDNTIAINPTNPDVLYVPVYDPRVVYVQAYDYGTPYITFGTGIYFSTWHYFYVDWHRRCIINGPWPRHGWNGGWYGPGRDGWHGGWPGHGPGQVWTPGRTWAVPPPGRYGPPPRQSPFGGSVMNHPPVWSAPCRMPPPAYGGFGHGPVYGGFGRPSIGGGFSRPPMMSPGWSGGYPFHRGPGTFEGRPPMEFGRPSFSAPPMYRPAPGSAPRMEAPMRFGGAMPVGAYGGPGGHGGRR